MLLAVGNATIVTRVKWLWSNGMEGPTLLFGLLGLLAALVAVRLFVNGLTVYELQLGLYLALFLFLAHHVIGASGIKVGAAVAAVPRFVADFSYSLYLTHFTLLVLLATMVSDGRLSRNAALWICLVGANGLAIAFWALFERHHRALARWFSGLIGHPPGSPVDPSAAMLDVVRADAPSHG
jgi:peptidoglycan/LPS O-acetylase OafA/YrhL